MSSLVQYQIDYLPTETELRKILGSSVPDRFIQDYVSVKRNVQQVVSGTDANAAAIATLTVQVNTLSGQVLSIQGQITTINGQIFNLNTAVTALIADVDALETLTNAHIAAQSAHDANGDIVGTNDYCTALVGGTVLLASSVADAAPVSTTPPAVVAAAGATYSQAYTQTQTDTINALRQNVIDLVAANNALVSVINQMLASERTAKQRAL